MHPLCRSATGQSELVDHIDDFSKIILDLENIEIEIEIEEEDQALLLRSLPKESETLSDTSMFGKDTLSSYEVQTTQFSTDLKKRNESKEEKHAEGLMVCGRPERRDQFRQKFRSRSKSRTKRNCFLCHKERHSLHERLSRQEEKAS